MVFALAEARAGDHKYDGATMLRERRASVQRAHALRRSEGLAGQNAQTL